MRDAGPDLKTMNRPAWTSEIAALLAGIGSVTPLGDQHIAACAEHGKTLLVSFETQQGIQALSPNALPFGWEMVQQQNWSNLCVISYGDTWFRDAAVFDYFDGLVDDGFFDAFDQVLFYGSGPCGYAAAAFSVVAPGARVLAIQPQATLDPRVTEWDTRFSEMRRVDFTRRYGYAPDMLDAAAQAFVVYDPRETEDAMHAALFTNRNVTKLRVPNMGSALQSDFLHMGILFNLIAAAGAETPTPAQFATLMRARRNHLPYLHRVLMRLERAERPALVKALCHNVTKRIHAPRLERRLKVLSNSAAAD